MALKRIVDSLDGVDEAFKILYTPKGDKFILSGIENHEDHEIVTSLRTENAGWRVKHRDASASLTAFAGLDPTAVRTALTENEALKAEVALLGSKDKKTFDDAVAARLKTETAPLQSKVTELTTLNESLSKENTTWKQTNTTRKIHDEARAACIALKVNESAYNGKWPDALRWAEANSEVGDDGKITEKESGLPLKDAIKKLQDDGQQLHWWGTSSGGGSRGSNDGPSGNANPWGKDTWNASAQGRIELADPARAKALATAAGVDVHAAFHPANGPKTFDPYA